MLLTFTNSLDVEEHYLESWATSQGLLTYQRSFSTFLFFVYLFVYSYVHILFGPSLPHATCSHPLLPTPLALFSNFVEEKIQAIIRKT
jgi:hypothetical protein